MARYQRRVVGYEDLDIGRDDLMSQEAAARLLEISLQALAGRIDRGVLTEVVDGEARNPRRGRRLLLKSEVEAAFLKKWQ